MTYIKMYRRSVLKANNQVKTQVPEDLLNIVLNRNLNYKINLLQAVFLSVQPDFNSQWQHSNIKY